ncbi:MAG: SMP-30/gluconolactonase/LRE family protein [Planctomycetota bacterium]
MSNVEFRIANEGARGRLSIRHSLFDIRHSSFVFAFAAALAALMGVMGGCHQPQRPIFPEHDPPLVWPDMPNPPRIRYVGQLRTVDDLKRPRSGFDALGDLLVGKKTPESLYGPRAVVCTREGNRVWVADPGGRCLHLFDLERRRYLKVQRIGDAQLLSPVGLSLGPAGSIYVCDAERVAIYRISDGDGRWLGTLRLPDELQRPAAMVYDEAAQELFVVDVTAHDVKVLDVGGALLRILGRRGTGPGQLNFPSAIAADEHRLWIADSGNHRVQAITRSGEPVAVFGQAGDAPGDLALPKGIAVDADGHVYVVDGRFENVQVFDTEGRLLLFFGEEGAGAGEFWLPGGVFIEPTGRIWVCDAYNRRLQVFQYIPESENVP